MTVKETELEKRLERKEAELREAQRKLQNTERSLLALANDVVALNEVSERVVTQIRALATNEYRIPIDIPDAA